MPDQKQFKPVLVLLYVVLAASFWKCFCVFPFGSANPNEIGFSYGTLPIAGAFFLFGVVPMLMVKLVFRENLADYGLRFGIVYRTMRSFCLAVPIIVLIAYLTGQQPVFHNVYPLNPALRSTETVALSTFVLHSVLYIGYYFGWEFLFRGFIQHGLSKHCGIATAILIQTLASTMLHYGHPPSEVFGAIIAGLVWGLLAYRTQSIFSGFGQHTLLGIVLDYVLIFDQ